MTQMKCPKCGNDCGRDEVHNGVAMLYGPWGCGCGWSETTDYDLTRGYDAMDKRGGVTDQFGNYHPPGSEGAEAFKTRCNEEWARYVANQRRGDHPAPPQMSSEP